jgi:hypothetical protein
MIFNNYCRSSTMRTYKRKTQRGMTPIETYKKGVAEVLKGRSYRSVAKELGINFMSLQRYCIKVKKAEAETSEGNDPVMGYWRNRQVFSSNMEKELSSYLQECAKMHYGLSTKELRRLAYEFALQNKVPIPTNWQANKMSTTDWLSGFLKRNTDADGIVATTSNTQATPLTSSQLFNTNPDDPMPSTSAACMDDNVATTPTSNRLSLHVSPSDIRPLPKAEPRIATRKPRQKRKSAVLTDTPNKDAIELEEAAKLRKIARKTPKRGRLFQNEKQKTKRQSEKKRKSSNAHSGSESDEEAFCLVCMAPFSNSKSKEKWIQCVSCKGWSHLRCTNASPFYTCQNCNSDDDKDDK